MYTVYMIIETYPKNDEQIKSWNYYINSKKICPFELLINRNNNNFSSLQKIFKTLALDNIRPEIFIDTYISAKKNNNIDYFVLCMTELFMSHKVNNALSEGQSIKSARTQTVARLLALSFSDSKKTEAENFKNMKAIVRNITKNIRT